MLKDCGRAIGRTGWNFGKERSIWNKTAKCSLGILTFAALIGGCGGGGGGSDDAVPPAIEQPGNEQALIVDSPQSLAQAISFQGGQLVEGDIPAPADASGGTISVTPEIAVTAGGDTQFSAQADVVDGYYVHAYLIQLEGSNSTFVIPVDANGQPASGGQQKLRAASDIHALASTLTPRNAVAQAPAATGRTQMSCTGHPNLSFTAGAAVEGPAPSYSAPATVVAYLQADVPPFTPPQITIPSMSRSREHWTQPTQVTVKAVQVGTGDFQITLTWDSTADVDLHLEEPGGHAIHYASRNSATGDGYLDVDDVDGYGPENIFFDTGLPAGNYTAKVHLYDAADADLPTNYTVTIKNNGSVNSYSGTLTAIDETDIVTQLTQSDTGSGSGDGDGNGDGDGDGDGDTALDWKDNWLFVNSDKAVQFRLAKVREEGVHTFFRIQYRVNAQDAIYTPSSNGYHLYRYTDDSTQYRVEFPASHINTIYELPIEIALFVDGTHVSWNEATNALVYHDAAYAPSFGTSCVDDNSAASRCEGTYAFDPSSMDYSFTAD